MKEQFVSYEIALKLKRLEFNEKCLASYYTDDEKNVIEGKYDLRKKLSSSIDFNPFENEFDNYYVNSDKKYYVAAPRKKYEDINDLTNRYKVKNSYELELIK